VYVLVTYDVSTVTPAGRKRLRRTALACKDYGVRVQNSVFEVKVEPRDWAILKARLTDIIDPELDSIRFYYLDRDVEIEYLGTKVPVDFEAPLVI